MSIPSHKIGLALGSGSARGWAHIGVIKALAEHGIHPDIVCGTSIGSFVGAAYVCDRLQELEDWARELDKRAIIKLMDVSFQAGGLVEGRKFVEFLRQLIGEPDFAGLTKQFRTVAANLNTGREVWLGEGDVLDAVRASMALPGFLTPFQTENSWLVDGGLVNPVPVSVCRALGAEVVIAVNLNGGIVGKHFDRNKPVENVVSRKAKSDTNSFEKLSDDVVEKLANLINFARNNGSRAPGLFDVMGGAINIMQDRITRSRMGGDPPDIVIEPRLADIGLFEFDRAAEAIEAGCDAVKRAEFNINTIMAK